MRAIVPILLLMLGALPVSAAPDLPASGSDESVSLPSFTESPGCNGPEGVRGPYATHAGYLPPEEPLLGPWGDFFGRDMAEVHDRLVPMQLPMTNVPFTVWVHERVAPALQQVIDNLEREADAGRHYTIRSGDTWSYNPITIPPGRSVSFHAVGAAIDINSATNPYRTDNLLVTDMPDWFVEAWTDAGWCWGGDWQEIKDPMHFSWRGPRYTPGYQTPEPFPARTTASDFAGGITVATGLGPTAIGVTHLIDDLDRDGAPDIVRLRSWTGAGHLGLEIATARTEHEACTVYQMTGRVPEASGGYALGDATGDGRPDLWAFDSTGPALRIELYRWDTGFERGGTLLPEIPTPGAMAYLVGDYDRDGKTDLFVIRSGETPVVEIWSGPRFRRAPSVFALPAAPGLQDRVALGDHDLDGIPDLYLLSAGGDLMVVTAAGSYSTPVTPAVGLPARPGSSFGTADYDGDGRDDLVFVHPDGTAAIHLGGVQDRGADLDSWFSGSWGTDWQLGQNCPPAPGFDLSPGFGGVQLADALGPGAAFVYPNPATGIWTLADLNWAWWHRLAGTLVDLEPIATAVGPGYAVLLAGDRTTVELRLAADGTVLDTVDVSGLDTPVDLAVVEYADRPALAVAFGGSHPRLIVRDLNGGIVARHRLAGLIPSHLLPLEDVSGDGNGDLAVIGVTAADRTGIRTLSIEAGLLARGLTSPWAAVAAAAVLPATTDSPSRVAVLMRSPDGLRGTLVTHNVSTGERLLKARVAPPQNGAMTATGADTLLVSFRNTRTGRVHVEGRNAVTGTRVWVRLADPGFDPADADAIPSGIVAVLGHRRGDANVVVAWWDAATGRRIG